MQVYMKKRVKSVTAIGQIHERMSLWGNSSLRYISLLSSNSSPLNHLFFLATFISEFFLLWASCCWDTWSPLLLLRALLWANSSLSTACLRCLHSPRSATMRWVTGGRNPSGLVPTSTTISRAAVSHHSEKDWKRWNISFAQPIQSM